MARKLHEVPALLNNPSSLCPGRIVFVPGPELSYCSLLLGALV